MSERDCDVEKRSDAGLQLSRSKQFGYCLSAFAAIIQDGGYFGATRRAGPVSAVFVFFDGYERGPEPP